MRIYIAGPMTGYKDLNYPAFEAAAKELEAAGHIPLNPASVDNGGEAHSWEWYMKRTIPMMCSADAVMTLKGWEGSRGAGIEVDLAIDLAMPVYDSIEDIPQ